MKVVLLEDVKSLGKKGDLVEISDGYARNFILPKKKGIEATAKNLNDLKLQKQHQDKLAAQQIDEAERLVLLHRHFHRAASAPFQGGEAGVPGERADAPAFSGPRHVHPSIFGLCQYYSMFLAYVK